MCLTYQNYLTKISNEDRIVIRLYVCLPHNEKDSNAKLNSSYVTAIICLCWWIFLKKDIQVWITSNLSSFLMHLESGATIIGQQWCIQMGVTDYFEIWRTWMTFIKRKLKRFIIIKYQQEAIQNFNRWRDNAPSPKKVKYCLEVYMFTVATNSKACRQAVNISSLPARLGTTFFCHV